AVEAHQAALSAAQARQRIAEQNVELQAENTRMGVELDVSRQLQQMVLPTKEELEQIPELDIAGFMEPAAEVGGDYYDVLRYNDRVIISIGDVTGHGLESGVLMMMVQTAIRTLTVNEVSDHAVFFRVLNRVLYDNVQRMKTDKNLTLLMMGYSEGVLHTSGQHEEILVVRKHGEIERIDTTDLGFMLGIEPDIDHLINYHEVRLEPGDGVVLYTDGITEAFHSEVGFYGINRLCEIIQQHWHEDVNTIKGEVIQGVHQFVGDNDLLDDITLVILKRC
ncbi:MAG: PP2C family protein-serine/threonine phosphatase, partial [Pseudomonadota bacterium]